MASKKLLLNQNDMPRICNRKNRDISKRSFSLIEVMIACVLIAVCGTVCSIKFKQSYDERRTKNVLQLIERKLQLASMVARVTQGPVTVIIEKDIPSHVYLDIDIRVPEKIKLLLNKKEELESVSKIELVPEPSFERNNLIKISFYPWGIGTPASHLEVYIGRAPFTVSLEKYAEAFSSPQANEITTIFPDAIIKYEKEKENLRSH